MIMVTNKITFNARYEYFIFCSPLSISNDKHIATQSRKLIPALYNLNFSNTDYACRAYYCQDYRRMLNICQTFEKHISRPVGKAKIL